MFLLLRETRRSDALVRDWIREYAHPVSDSRCSWVKVGGVSLGDGFMWFGTFMSVICALVGALRFDSDRIRFGVIRFVFFVIAGMGMAYLNLPVTTGLGLGGWWSWLATVMAANMLLWLLQSMGAPESVGPGGLLYTPAVFGVLGVLWLSHTPMLHSEQHVALAGDVATADWKNDMTPVDPTKIRLVSQEQAVWLGKKALSDGYGAVFAPGEYRLQKVGDRMVWVAQLDFIGLSSWLNNDCTPGYIVVDAHDPSRSAQLQVEDGDGKKIAIRYTPNAFFGRDLFRHIYMAGHSDVALSGAHLELDDQYRPFWVITGHKRTIGLGGLVPHTVFIVDPENGEIEEHAVTDVPAWVDRIVPEEVVVNNLNKRGLYHQGWWNAFLGKPGLTETTDSSLVYGEDGRCYWYSQTTSPSNSDDTMLSFVLTDSRTGISKEYELHGGTAGTAEAALGAVAQKVSNFRGYHPASAIPYNVYGHLAYVSPVLGETHMFQRVAVTDVNCQIVGMGDDLNTALQEFRSLIGQGSGNSVSPTQSAQTRTITVRVSRIAEATRSGNSTVYLYTTDVPGRVFFGGPTLGPDLFLTREDDSVVIQYLDTNESSIPIQSITNPSISGK
jgi:hypothetical protein